VHDLWLTQSYRGNLNDADLERIAGSKDMRPHVGVCHSLVDQRGLLQGRQGDVKIRWITFSTSYSASRYLPRCINLALQSFENHSQKPHSLQRCA
jgi:hypothetical protein